MCVLSFYWDSLNVKDKLLFKPFSKRTLWSTKNRVSTIGFKEWKDYYPYSVNTIVLTCECFKWPVITSNNFQGRIPCGSASGQWDGFLNLKAKAGPIVHFVWAMLRHFHQHFLAYGYFKYTEKRGRLWTFIVEVFLSTKIRWFLSITWESFLVFIRNLISLWLF